MFVLSERATGDEALAHATMMILGGVFFGDRAVFYSARHCDEECNGNDGHQQARFCKSRTGRAKHD